MSLPPQSNKREIDFDPENIASWFQDDVSGMFVSLVTSIAVVLEKADEEIDAIEKSGLDESYVERGIREIKANAYDRLTETIVDLA